MYYLTGPGCPAQEARARRPGERSFDYSAYTLPMFVRWPIVYLYFTYTLPIRVRLPIIYLYFTYTLPIRFRFSYNLPILYLYFTYTCSITYTLPNTLCDRDQGLEQVVFGCVCLCSVSLFVLFVLCVSLFVWCMRLCVLVVMLFCPLSFPSFFFQGLEQVR